MTQTDFRTKFASAKAVADLVSPTAIAAGSGICRLLGVVMLGPQYSSYLGAPTKIVQRLRLEFEAFGPTWPLMNGELPTFSRYFTYSNAGNSTFGKVWKTLNWEETANNPLQLIGEIYTLELLTPSGEKKSLDMELGCPVVKSRGAAPKVLQDARTEMPETITPLYGFDYDHPTPADWASLYRSGHSEEGLSFNFVQNDIRAAVNFRGGPVAAMLTAMKRDLYTDYDESGNEIAGSRLRNIEAVKETHKRNGKITENGYFTGVDTKPDNLDDINF